MMSGNPRPARAHRWTGHPGVRSGDELTTGERAADRLRNGMGSWTFVLSSLALLGVWRAEQSQLLALLDRREDGEIRSQRLARTASER